MRLEQSFEVQVPVAQAWGVLLDVERVAPCIPGVTLAGFDGSSFTGNVAIKLGPMSLTFKGSGRFVERDEAGKRIAFIASGQDTRGSGGAQARVSAVLHGANGGAATLVRLVADVDMAGKAAQVAGRVLADVNAAFIKGFATNLSRALANGSAPAVPAYVAAEPVFFEPVVAVPVVPAPAYPPALEVVSVPLLESEPEPVPAATFAGDPEPLEVWVAPSEPEAPVYSEPDDAPAAYSAFGGAEPAGAEPAWTESVDAESVDAEPVAVEIAESFVVEVEPVAADVEPAVAAEPTAAEPSYPAWTSAEPGFTEWAATGTTHTDPEAFSYTVAETVVDDEPAAASEPELAVATDWAAPSPVDSFEYPIADPEPVSYAALSEPEPGSFAALYAPEPVSVASPESVNHAAPEPVSYAPLAEPEAFSYSSEPAAYAVPPEPEPEPEPVSVAAPVEPEPAVTPEPVAAAPAPVAASEQAAAPQPVPVPESAAAPETLAVKAGKSALRKVIPAIVVVVIVVVAVVVYVVTK